MILHFRAPLFPHSFAQKSITKTSPSTGPTSLPFFAGASAANAHTVTMNPMIKRNESVFIVVADLVPGGGNPQEQSRRPQREAGATKLPSSPIKRGGRKGSRKGRKFNHEWT